MMIPRRSHTQTQPCGCWLQARAQTNGEDALLAAETGPPAFVILDLLMSGVDRCEFYFAVASHAGRASRANHRIDTVTELDADERLRLQAAVF